MNAGPVVKHMAKVTDAQACAIYAIDRQFLQQMSIKSLEIQTNGPNISDI